MFGMLQVITRKDGEKAKKETIEGIDVQIAYNDKGRLTLRVKQEEGQDTLIVLNKAVSYQTINFIQKNICNPVYGSMPVPPYSDSSTDDELPF